MLTAICVFPSLPEWGYRGDPWLFVGAGIDYTLEDCSYCIYGYQTWVPTGKYYNLNISSFTFRVGIDF